MALTPEQIAGLREATAAIAAPINEWLLQDAAQRIAMAGKMTSTAAYELYRAKAMGESERALKRYLKQQLKLSNKEIRRLFKEAARFSRDNDMEKAGLGGFDFQDARLDRMALAAVALAQKDFTNLTQTLGMVTPGGRVQPLRKFYRETMDFAFQQIFTGAADYNTAIRLATNKMTDAGVRVIDYESGVHTGIEAAVRRNMMGGLGLMDEQITKADHDEFGCNGWEISAHANSAPDHEPYQGRQYSDEEYTALNGRLKRRIGTLNCGHVAFPIILGVSSPQYTELQLQAFKDDNAAGVSCAGKHYTGYEATQKQRQIERTIRKQKNRILVAEQTGDENTLLAARIRLTRLRQEYRAFSKATGLPTQEERLWVSGFGKKKNVQTMTLQNADHMGQPHIFETITTKNKNGEIVAERHPVKCYKNDLYTNIWCQTNTQNSQDMCAYLNEVVNNQNKYGHLDKIVVVKRAKLPGYAAYDHDTNVLFISEELIDPKLFKEMVDHTYFPARDVKDVLLHELGGHKAHWDAVDRFWKANTNRFSNLMEAKTALEMPLREYVAKQMGNNPMYLTKTVSRNANVGWERDSLLHELIADVIIKYNQGTLSDPALYSLVREVISYDGVAK